jgi:DNA topoisomerase-2
MAKKKSAAEGEIEKTYQKKTQLEHILLRPDTYIGTTEKIREKMWVIDEKSGKMINKEIEYVPGLYKIFDEILVNAVDNISRDQRMSLIKVDITPKRITIFNNGKGIPIKIHNTYNIYVPELIFGHLLTSSNYNDNEKKITGGRNGFGAKLTNVFSKLFIVETADKKVKKKYKIEYSDNMTKHKEAEIEKYEGEDFTRVTFEPDFRKFKMTELDNDIISLLKKRVYDVAGTSPSRIKVYLNDKLIEIKDFSEYADLYIKNRYFDEDSKVLYPKILANSTDRWEVIFSMTDGSFQQVSFVNGICTSKGGTHVNYILDQILERILETIKKKAKDIKLNTNQIKQNIWVFINCKIENPSFDSQTKETLTSKVSNFGSECIIKEKFIKEILKSNIVTNIIEYGKAKAKIKLHKALSSTVKKSSRLLGIEKLEDANLAGTKDFEKCTLILTEGDSAKCLAMAGIEVVGRDYYGCFPLRG